MAVEAGIARMLMEYSFIFLNIHLKWKKPHKPITIRGSSHTEYQARHV
jgi:hypothetical protein